MTLTCLRCFSIFRGCSISWRKNVLGVWRGEQMARLHGGHLEAHGLAARRQDMTRRISSCERWRSSRQASSTPRRRSPPFWQDSSGGKGLPTNLSLPSTFSTRGNRRLNGNADRNVLGQAGLEDYCRVWTSCSSPELPKTRLFWQ